MTNPGPVVLVTVQLYELSRRVWAEEEAPDAIVDRFLELMALVGMFVGLFMLIIACFELSRFCAKLTRFTLEVFEVFVCTVTFWLGFERIISNFTRARQPTWTFGDALFSTTLACITFFLSMMVSGVGSAQRGLTPRLRSALTDYAVALAVLLVIACVGN